MYETFPYLHTLKIQVFANYAWIQWTALLHYPTEFFI